MSDLTIRVEGLGKQFRIGARQEGYKTLRDTLAEAAMGPVRAVRSLARRGGGRRNEEESVWALKDVSFEVRRGDVVGIIGRNGAGKSTLLKILSRITEPTDGYADINGRVGSLLEVGTGFHPELTGRENIFLNGAILGMKRSDILLKFDEIVSFAEVGKFIDTPVKHYSSGMYLRLAFAVAAHLEPEILIVDEVLAVGDSAFQKKCLGRMSVVAGEGRTVLFVSHNMAAIQNLCTRGILLDKGTVVADSEVLSVTSQYLESMNNLSSIPVAQRYDREGNGKARLVNIRLINSDSHLGTAVTMGSDWNLELSYECEEEIPSPKLDIVILTNQGQKIAKINSQQTQGDLPSLVNRVRLNCEISRLNLLPGFYHLTTRLTSRHGVVVDRLESAIVIEVGAADRLGTGRFGDGRHSPCYYPANWKLMPVC